MQYLALFALVFVSVQTQVKILFTDNGKLSAAPNIATASNNVNLDNELLELNQILLKLHEEQVNRITFYSYKNVEEQQKHEQMEQRNRQRMEELIPFKSEDAVKEYSKLSFEIFVSESRFQALNNSNPHYVYGRLDLVERMTKLKATEMAVQRIINLLKTGGCENNEQVNELLIARKAIAGRIIKSFNEYVSKTSELLQLWERETVREATGYRRANDILSFYSGIEREIKSLELQKIKQEAIDEGFVFDYDPYHNRHINEEDYPISSLFNWDVSKFEQFITHINDVIASVGANCVNDPSNPS
jgi:hypothetical protein